jgi:hypothetical protein
MMADELLNDGDDDIFVYMGGEQEVPFDVRRAKIDESVDTVLAMAFYDCEQLIEVKGHRKLKKIEKNAFRVCRRLRRVTKMNGVIEIEQDAFVGCNALSELDFGKLEIIGDTSFAHCKSLRSINMPSIRRIGKCAFQRCDKLSDAVFGEKLGIIEDNAFNCCDSLRRIAIPLKRSLIIGIIPMPHEENPGEPFGALRASLSGAFSYCKNLSRVDIVGGVYKTISSLHMESWKDTMKEEINRINQTLPAVSEGREKTVAIKEWIESVLDRMEHYKAEHKLLLREAMALLELALWKVKLIDEIDGKGDKSREQGKRGASQMCCLFSNCHHKKRARQERRITSGASIVIKNVLPFLQVVDITQSSGG